MQNNNNNSTTTLGMSILPTKTYQPPLTRYRPLMNVLTTPEGPCEFAQLGELVVGRVTLTPHAVTQVDSHHQPIREDGSVANRKIVPGNLIRLLEALSDSTFMFTGEPLIFDDNMKLIDGRHRCTACLTSGTPMDVLVVIGVPNQSFKFLDQGASRSNATVLQLLGHQNYRDKAAACRALYLFTLTGSFDTSCKTRNIKGFTNAIVRKMGGSHRAAEVLAEYPGLEKAACFLRSRKRAATLMRHRGSLSALVYCLLSIDPGLTTTFFDVLNMKDEELYTLNEEHSPILRLRGRLNKDRDLGLEETAALVIKAWNLLRSGATRQVLSWSREKEEFPRISGLLYDKTTGFPIVPKN